MNSDLIPFILYAAGAALMALVLVIVWSDGDIGIVPATGKRRAAYQTSRFRPPGRGTRHPGQAYGLQRPARGRLARKP